MSMETEKTAQDEAIDLIFNVYLTDCLKKRDGTEFKLVAQFAEWEDASAWTKSKAYELAAKYGNAIPKKISVSIFGANLEEYHTDKLA